MEENDKILRLDRSKRESEKKFEKAFEIEEENMMRRFSYNSTFEIGSVEIGLRSIKK